MFEKGKYNEAVRQLYRLAPKEVQKRVNEQSDLYATYIRYHSFFTDESYFKREIDYVTLHDLIMLELERDGLIG